MRAGNRSGALAGDLPPGDGRRRVVIEAVSPEVDGGRFPIKRTVGEPVVVEADVFADGHDVLAAALRFWREDGPGWQEVRMRQVEEDRWRGAFTPTELGRYRYTVHGWVDRFATWRRDLERKVDAGQDVAVDLLVGAELVERTAARAVGPDRRRLRSLASALREGPPAALRAALGPELAELMDLYQDRRPVGIYDRDLAVVVDSGRARFSAWYELFPRSAATEPGRHGTFADLEKRLPYVAGLGFDVLYLPPIHPIGRTYRRGRNNAPVAGPEDPGSPWAIGSEEGGHTAVHPELGTIEDFDRLVAAAREHGLEVALDLAFQCSPDHPWVREHPEWFRRCPDGSIRHAENPPKSYPDIVPLDFEGEAWRELWEALREVVEFWISHGVRTFRVDNPHTKPFAFWEWLIDSVKARHPDVVFLAEAFTRPRVMYRLAKAGFTQSYTYFAWRNTRAELEQYFGQDLPAVREFFRPNLWPNTPDILTEVLQTGGRPAFIFRLVLAATLGASYGIYGPAYELMENRAVAEGSEEYLDSEKYEIRWWDLDRPDSLAELIARVNRIRRDNPSLHADRGLRFHGADNDRLIAYSKATEDRSNVVLVVVNLDPHHTQSGWVDLDLSALGVDPDHPFQVHDLLTEARYVWSGPRNYVELHPEILPAHVFRVRPRLAREQDFDYFR